MNKRTARRLAAATALAIPGTVGVQVATAAPTILTPGPNSTIGGRSVTIFGQYTAPRPVASAKIFLDNLLLATRTFRPAGRTGTLNLTWDSTVALPGAHRITVKMYDAGGRLVAQDSVPVSIANSANGAPVEDTIPPQVAVMAPSQSGELQGTFDIKVLATDDSGKDPYVSVFVDNQLRGVSNRQPYSFSVDSSEYDNGVHSVEAWAYDAANNKGTSNTVAVRFNNPGGATTLNEDVNRLGAAPADASADVPVDSAIPATADDSPATAPALPVVATSLATSPTQPVAAPKLTPARPKPAKAAPKPARPLPSPAKPASTPKPEGPKSPVAPDVPGSSITASQPADPRRVLMVHIPPVPQVAVTARHDPEAVQTPAETTVAKVDDSAPAIPSAIQELPTETATVADATVADAAGIQELDVQPAAIAPDATPEVTPAPSPATSAPVPAAPAAAPATRPVPAKRLLAQALPGAAPKALRPMVADPAHASKPAPQPVAIRPATPKPASTRVAKAPRAPKTLVAEALPMPEPAPAEAVETVAGAAPRAITEAPIVLKMRGDRVVEASPVPVRIAKASDSAQPESTSIPAAARPEAGNPAPAPKHIAAAPRATAPAVRVDRPVRRSAPARLARATATTPVPNAPELRPDIIRELPADRVERGQIRHAVRPGESAAGLARHYGVPVKRLLAENSLGRRYSLRIGQVLAIPTPVRVAFNDETVAFDVAPRIENGVTLAALRQIYEQAGGKLTWNAMRREVRATGGGANIVLRIGSREALVDGRRVALDTATQVVDGRTLVPVEFVRRALSLRAEYDLRSGAISLHTASVDADRRRPV